MRPRRNVAQPAELMRLYGAGAIERLRAMQEFCDRYGRETEKA
jgi:hypothetical protein